MMRNNNIVQPLLTDYQMRFFIEWVKSPKSSRYNLSCVIKIDGNLVVQLLKDAAQAIVKRQRLFSARFSDLGDMFFVDDLGIDNFFYGEELDGNRDIKEQLTEIINQPFDLSNKCLIRAYLLMGNKTELPTHYFIISAHHVIMDAVSVQIIIKQLEDDYNKLLNRQPLDINPDNSFFEACDLIREKLTDEYNSAAQKYWQNYLEDIPLVIDLPIKSNSCHDKAKSSTIFFDLTKEAGAAIRQLAKETHSTLFITISSLFGVLLAKYANQQNVVLSYPLNMRPLGYSQTIGCFVNNLPVKIQLENHDTFRDLIKTLVKQRKESRAYQNYSFSDIVNDQKVLRKERDANYFNVGLAETYLNTTPFNLQGLDSEFVDLPWNEQSIYQIQLLYDPSEFGKIKFKLEYQKSMFEPWFIEDLIESFFRLIGNSVKEDINLSSYCLLDDKTYKKVIYDWNNTDMDYPKDKTIHQLFEEQVQRTPDSIAVVFEEQSLTYWELNKQANQLAHKIRKTYKEQTNQELEPDTLIVLCLDRSLEVIIAILAVLKAGGAYVPLDPEHPEDRISYILDDTRTKLVLTQSRHIDKLKQITIATLLDLADYTGYQSESETAPETNTEANNLAYVVYTSGTTGKPKGVMIEHTSIVDYLDSFSLLLGEDKKIGSFLSYSFDGNVPAMLTICITKACVYIYSINTVRTSIILRDKVNIFKLTPSMIGLLDLSQINYEFRVIFGGEKLPLKELNALSKNRNLLLFNQYGPTEVSVGSHVFRMHDDLERQIIGKAYKNTKTYILDNSLRPVPIGVIGELYIAGAGLARGYLNNPELTAERFIPNPFATESDIVKGYTRMYKTGDLVRWLPDGNLEYIGRNDFQVKIRGFRIELGEIEEQLVRIEGIKQACVIARTRAYSNQQYLAAYYVLDQDSIALSKETILDRLSLVLPDYMLPSTLMELAALPLTINGKLDRQALPEAEFVYDDYVAPVTELEQTLVQIWSSVLGLESDKLGIRDDFFRVGGDSILSIQLSSRLRKAGYSLSVRDIFDKRNIASLAKYLEQQADSLEHPIITESGVLTGELSLLPIQSWFFERVASGDFALPNHWNQSFLVKVPKLDTALLQAAITKLLMQHDVLRISYNYDSTSGKYQQNYNDLTGIVVSELAHLDVSNKSSAEISSELTELQSNFNLNSGPLWQIAYLDGYSDDSARVFFALHHLIVDAVSWRILIEDLEQLLAPSLNQHVTSLAELPTKGSSYRQWVNEIHDYSTKYAAEANYWHSVIDALPDYSKYTNLAKSQDDREQRVTQNHAEFILSPELTKILLQQANQAYHSETNDLLLTALAYTLKDWNNSTIQGITLEGHGREDINPELNINHTVGWFTSMYPVKLELADNLSNSIKQIKESLRSIPHKGIGFGSFVQNPEFDLSFSQLPAISFNYLGQFDNKNNSDNIEGNENTTKRQSTNPSYWQIASESSGISMAGENKDHNLININGMVIDGKLSFSIVSYLDSTTTQQIADSFKTQLEQLIQHCKELLAKAINYHTPSDFEDVSISQSLLDKLEQQAQDINNEIVAIYPANSLQQGFIYHAISQTEDDAYRVQMVFSYNQELNLENYIEAWNLAIAKFPILRTCFNWEEAIIQLIYKKGKLSYSYHDLSSLNPEQQSVEIIRLQQEERSKSFDLTKTELLRLSIIKQSNNCYSIIKTEHHSIADGWSGPILLEQVHDSYKKLEHQQTINLQIDDAYLHAQEYIARHSQAAQEYWKYKLASYPELRANDLNVLLSHKLDLNSVRALEDVYDASLSLSPEQTQELKQHAQKLGVTLNTLVQFAWHKLIHSYTRDEQTIVGSTIAGRDIPISGIEHSVGLYINTLPLIIDWSVDKNSNEQIQDIHAELTQLNTHSFANLASIQSHGERLFHSLLVFENYPVPDTKQTSDKLQVEFNYAVEKLDYPLGITAYEHNGQLSITIKSARDLLDEQQAHDYLAKLQLILEQLKHNPKSSTIALLSKEEYQTIVYDWNNTDKDYPKDKTIHQLFEEQVQRTPDNIAIVFEDKSLTYRELNKRANQLAHKIRKTYKEQTDQKLEAETLIALCLDRSLEMIIAILATLKAGAAYVPLDPEYPEDRISYILDDTKTRLLLTQSWHINKLKYITIATLLDVADYTGYQSESETAPEINVKANNLAYVIYTSGTTGIPKGAMIEHRAFSSFIAGFTSNNELEKLPSYNVLSLTSYTFDIFALEYAIPLISGSYLKIQNNLDISRADLSDINIIQQTPSSLQLLCESAIDQNQLKDKLCLVGGEALNLNTAKILFNKFKTVLNVYGPSETTIWSSSYKINDPENILIGTPLDNEKVYVLDHTHAPVPVSVIGELYIAGAGLARGYLNKPELTAERFIPNPFATESDIAKGYTRMYKTGDLVRWLPDGYLEYVGRNDFQVKINGVRIELGEIESRLISYSGIKQAVVRVEEGAGENQYLVGYYVADTELDSNTILNYLGDYLPNYMLPSILVYLEKFPLTVNGKLDRKALPKPEFSSQNIYEAPRNEVETVICNVFAEVLNISAEKIGIHDDFFKLGGNSILAIRIVSKLNSLLFSNIKVADIFKYKTAESLGALIISMPDSFIYKDYIVKQMDAENLYKPFEMNNVQQAYYVGRLGGVELGNTSTHIYSEYRFKYLDIKSLELAINKLIHRHHAFRTIFIGGKQQYLKEYPYYKVEYNELKNIDGLLEIRDRLSHKIYNVEQFPLFDFMVSKCDFTEGECYYILHLSLDVLLMDANSLQQVADELGKFYADPELELPELPISYRDYLIRMQEIRESKLFDDAREYWMAKLEDYNFEMQLPLLCKPSLIQKPRFNRITKTISMEKWQAIEAQSAKYNIGLTSLVMSVYGYVLSNWTNQYNVCINLTLFNRMPLHSQINDIVGDFTVLELFNYNNSRVIDKISIKDILQVNHQQLWEDIEHNLFDGIDFQREIRKAKDLADNQVIAPIVLTSVLSGSKNVNKQNNLSFLNGTVNYSITQTPQVWLDNKAYDSIDGFVAEWDYVEQLIDRNTIEGMHAAYCQVIEYLADVDWEYNAFSEILLPDLDNSIIQGANLAVMPLSEETLFSYYEKQTQINRRYSKIAVIDYSSANIHEYSYGQLFNESELLAKHIYSLLSVQRKPTRLIAILSEKGYNQVVGSLAIMKAGYAYLPLHVDWPVERISEILTQGEVDYILISKKQSLNRDLADKLSSTYNLLIIEEVLGSINTQLINHNHYSIVHDTQFSKISDIQLPEVSVDAVAYVIFTSGSTGKPKGVTISHRGVLNTILSVNDNYGLKETDRILALSELSFDLSVYDIFGMLACGGTIIFPEQTRTKEPDYWIKLIKQHNITIWNSIPQLGLLLINEVQLVSDEINLLRLFLFSGDWTPLNLPDKIKAKLPKSTVVSLGGATEGSIWSIWYEITDIPEYWSSIPYGVAMPNQKMYVLTNEGHHCPLEVIGEIYIGGIGVALNYWNDRKKTSDSFIEHPQLGRLYKTGDLGCWKPEGYIEFRGRKDYQVKVSGYRIELGEIENKLVNLPGVEAAITTVFEHEKHNYIIGYLVPRYKQQIKERYVNYKEILVKDKELFRLAKHGIRNDLVGGYKLPLEINEKIFRKRKSYRQFENKNISVDIVDSVIQSSVTKAGEIFKSISSKLALDFKSQSFFSEGLDELQLAAVLEPLSCIQLADRILPRYLYPSAGSSYAIRSYVWSTAKLSEDLAEGYYYYNPLSHELCGVELNSASWLADRAWKFDADAAKFNSLDLVINWPSIFPLYGEESYRFAYLEVGHIISLVTQRLNEMGFNWIIELGELEFGDVVDQKNYKLKLEDSLLARIIIYAGTAREQPTYADIGYFKNGMDEPKHNVFYRDKYQYSMQEDNHSVINLKDKSVFEQTHCHSGRVLESASCLITLNGTQTVQNLVYAGALFQILGDSFYDENYGSCMLGYEVYPDVLYSVAIGAISEEAKLLADTEVIDVPFRNYIDYYLSQQLPQYMLPHEYVIMERLPLTANGKLDRKALPKPELGRHEDYVAPRSDIEVFVCNIFAEILNLPAKQVGIHDDFFKLGGNSILAIKAVTGLKKQFHVDLNDLFTLRTPEKIVETLIEKTSLVLQASPAEKLKSVYEYMKRITPQTTVKETAYYRQIRNIDFECKLKGISCVLLTGGTGFLGSNLLYHLLNKTTYQIYLLVRAPSIEEAYARIKAKFAFYFERDLDFYRDRLKVIPGNIELPDLAVSSEIYQELIREVDSIIHCAALTKHYGSYDKFYRANVQATINLLDLAKLTGLKDFHYMSTKFIWNEGYIPDSNYAVITEDDHEILLGTDNFYLRSKYEGEQAVIRYREYGITGNIYRVGNLVMHSENHKFQENIEDNGFYQRVKTLLQIGYVPIELAMVELSPVNWTALAIVTLFDQEELKNQTFHVYNPNIGNLLELFSGKLREMEFNDFVDLVFNLLANGKDTGQLELFLLHQGWLHEIDVNHLTKIEILSGKTCTILNLLGFRWGEVQSIMLSGFENDVIVGSFQEYFLKELNNVSNTSNKKPTS